MTAWQSAEKLYDGDTQRFKEDVEYHTRHHFAFCSPFCIILARLESDHWLVYLAVGQGCLSYFLHIMPIYRASIRFARPLKQGACVPLKSYSTEKLKQLILN